MTNMRWQDLNDGHGGPLRTRCEPATDWPAAETGGNAACPRFLALLGGIHDPNDPLNTYKSLDGLTTYVLSGTDLIVNGVLTVNENFQSGQFGIGEAPQIEDEGLKLVLTR